MARLASDIHKETGCGVTVVDGQRYQWTELSELNIDTLEATAIFKRADGVIQINHDDERSVATSTFKLKAPVVIGIEKPKPKWAKGKTTEQQINEWNEHRGVHYGFDINI